jgi:hypothetical protein
MENENNWSKEEVDFFWLLKKWRRRGVIQCDEAMKELGIKDKHRFIKLLKIMQSRQAVEGVQTSMGECFFRPSTYIHQFKDPIEENMDLLFQSTCSPFEKHECPKCKKSAILISIIKPEWSNEKIMQMTEGKIPKVKRHRGDLYCPYCNFGCRTPEELKEFGIEPEVEI